MAVIILKKKTTFDSRGELQDCSYSGERHEIDANSSTASGHRVENDAEKISPKQPQDNNTLSISRESSLEGCQRNTLSAIHSNATKKCLVKAEYCDVPRRFSKRHKPSNPCEVSNEEINNAAEISSALQFKGDNIDTNSDTEMECHSTETKKDANMMNTLDHDDDDDNESDEDHKLVKRKQFLERNKIEYFKIDELQLANYNEKIEQSVEVLQFAGNSRKQYMCTICHKICSENYLAKVHAKIHFKQRPYKCKKCKMGFKDMLSLNSHVNVKHRNVKYDCPSCPERFDSTGGLYKHLTKTGHRVNKD